MSGGHLKALTIHQPYASLLGFTFKEYETRGWCPSPAQLKAGDWLALHAAGYGAMKAAKLDGLLDLPAVRQTLGQMGITPGSRTQANLPLGVVIAMAQIEGFYPTDTLVVKPLERDLGDFSPGRWAWRLVHVMRLSRPIQCSGKQGLWTLEYKTRLQVFGQLLADSKIVPVPGLPHAAGLLDG